MFAGDQRDGADEQDDCEDDDPRIFAAGLVS